MGFNEYFEIFQLFHAFKSLYTYGSSYSIIEVRIGPYQMVLINSVYHLSLINYCCKFMFQIIATKNIQLCTC